MESNRIGKELSAQFERTHQMLIKTIESYQGPAWVVGKENYLVPARLAYHLVETIEYYLSDVSSEEFSWGGRFGGDWEGMPALDLPGQKEMIEYLGEMMTELRKQLSAQKDETFLAENLTFPWTGKTKLGHILYVMRHSLHHHGELCALLYESGCKEVNWR